MQRTVILITFSCPLQYKVKHGCTTTWVIYGEASAMNWVTMSPSKNHPQISGMIYTLLSAIRAQLCLRVTSSNPIKAGINFAFHNRSRCPKFPEQPCQRGETVLLPPHPHHHQMLTMSLVLDWSGGQIRSFHCHVSLGWQHHHAVCISRCLPRSGCIT